MYVLFSMLQRQWRTVMNGNEGLDYAALYPLLDRKYPDPDDWDRAFDEIRLMESEAIKAMRK